MMSDEIRITYAESIMIITLHRPQRRNAINRAAADALKAAWAEFDANPQARVGILTGGDEVFCAGADLKEFQLLDETPEGDGPLGFTRSHVSKPTIAAIAGYAVAGGLEIACWCDLRIVDETAIFGCFERRFGVPLFDGGTVRLPQIIGLGRALELIMTGRAVDAQEAKSMGLANEVVSKGQHLARAIEIAKMLATFPQAALLGDRKSVYATLGKSLDEALKIEAQIGYETMQTGEAASGAHAFTAGKGRHGQER